MNYHENARLFYDINKLIVNLNLIVSHDTNIKEYATWIGKCSGTYSIYYEEDDCGNRRESRREQIIGQCGYTETVYAYNTERKCKSGCACETCVEAGTVRGEGNSTAAAQADANSKAQQQANSMQCRTQYSSARKTGTATRNNCGSGCTGTSVTYVVEAGKYKSCVSQADADRQAQNDVDSNKQSYANSHGKCNCPVKSCFINVDLSLMRDTATRARLDAYVSQFDKSECETGNVDIEILLDKATFNSTGTNRMVFTTNATGTLISGTQINIQDGYSCENVSVTASFAGFSSGSSHDCPECELTYGYSGSWCN